MKKGRMSPALWREFPAENLVLSLSTAKNIGVSKFVMQVFSTTVCILEIGEGAMYKIKQLKI